MTRQPCSREASQCCSDLDKLCQTHDVCFTRHHIGAVCGCLCSVCAFEACECSLGREVSRRHVSWQQVSSPTPDGCKPVAGLGQAVAARRVSHLCIVQQQTMMRGGGCSTSGQPRSTETPQRQTCFTQTGGLVILCTHASCQHESCQQTHMLGGCWMRSPLWQLLSPEVLTLATPSQHPLAWRRIMCWPVKAQVDQCSKTDEFQCAGLRLCEPPACV